MSRDSAALDSPAARSFYLISNFEKKDTHIHTGVYVVRRYITKPQHCVLCTIRKSSILYLALLAPGEQRKTTRRSLRVSCIPPCGRFFFNIMNRLPCFVSRWLKNERSPNRQRPENNHTTEDKDSVGAAVPVDGGGKNSRENRTKRQQQTRIGSFIIMDSLAHFGFPLEFRPRPR